MFAKVKQWLPFGEQETDDGCEYHHFGEWEEVGDFKVAKRFYMKESREIVGSREVDSFSVNWLEERTEDVELIEAFALLSKQRKSCQHTGCRKSYEKYKTKFVFPKEEFEEMVEKFGYTPEEFNEEFSNNGDS